jgi:hypothetical protein
VSSPPDHATEHHVLWHCARLASSEHAALFERAGEQRFHGFVVLPAGERPCHIEYEVELDNWQTRRAHARVTVASDTRLLELRRDATGAWTRDGAPAPELDGCSDVDLGWSPATNTLPIRRLGLGNGDRATIRAAWVRFPELDVVAAEQHYTRVSDVRWRYQSGAYDFELGVDPSTGLVLAYGDDLWRAVTISGGATSQ